MPERSTLTPFPSPTGMGEGLAECVDDRGRGSMHLESCSTLLSGTRARTSGLIALGARPYPLHSCIAGAHVGPDSPRSTPLPVA